MAASGPVAAETPIAPSVARLFVGEDKVLQGVVTDSERDESTVRLRVGSAPQHVEISLVPGVLSSFPPEPEKYYLGKRLLVSGTIRDFRGTPEIVVRDPAQIRVLTELPGTGLAAVPAPARRVAELPPPTPRPPVPTPTASPEAVAVLPAVPPPAVLPGSGALSSAPPAATEPTLRALVERLSEQVQRLEQRIELLEQRPTGASPP